MKLTGVKELKSKFEIQNGNPLLYTAFLACEMILKAKKVL